MTSSTSALLRRSSSKSARCGSVMSLVRKIDNSTSSYSTERARSTWLLISMPTPSSARLTVTVTTVARVIRGLSGRPMPTSASRYRHLGAISVHPSALVAYDLTVLQFDDPPAHRVNDVLVVGCHHHCGAGPVDAVQQLHD